MRPWGNRPASSPHQMRAGTGTRHESVRVPRSGHSAVHRRGTRQEPGTPDRSCRRQTPQRPEAGSGAARRTRCRAAASRTSGRAAGGGSRGPRAALVTRRATRRPTAPSSYGRGSGCRDTGHKSYVAERLRPYNANNKGITGQGWQVYASSRY